jgi:hypothetical protein
VTLPSFRRKRPPVLIDEFRVDEAATGTIGRVPDWDATTVTFTGVSAIGLGPDAQPFARPPDPETLPALPPPPEPVRRPVDDAIFVIIWSARGFGLLCGMDLWRRHADPEAAHYRNQFDALRVSALRAGWLPDRHGRWCCPRCVAEPSYATPKPLDHYHPGVVHARAAADPAVSRGFWEARPAIDYHRDAADAFAAGDPAAEFWFRVEAEAEVLARTADGAWHGRHEVAR